MFEHAPVYRTWVDLLLGAMLFASLFVVATLMEELVFGGQLAMTRTVVAFGGMAFFGYIGVALLTRPRRRRPRRERRDG